MNSIQPCPIPAGASLESYSKRGSYTDCYSVSIQRTVTQSEFVEAFYTTTVFKVERFLLATVLSLPSTDAEATLLASGKVDRFAAWSVEQRMSDQLLLAAGPTRSWLMVSAIGEPAETGTRLYFGSAVVPTRQGRNRTAVMGWQFHALLGFHKLYSRILLRAAARKLRNI
jgi:hypothetical protein